MGWESELARGHGGVYNKVKYVLLIDFSRIRGHMQGVILGSIALLFVGAAECHGARIVSPVFLLSEKERPDPRYFPGWLRCRGWVYCM